MQVEVAKSVISYYWIWPCIGDSKYKGDLPNNTKFN